jgi:hypothetical protein
MQSMRKVLLCCAGIWVAAGVPAAAGEPIDAAARIEQMRATGRELSALAAEPLPELRSPQERQEAEAYRAFLARAARDLEALAGEWERAQVTDRASTAGGGDAQAALLNATRQLQERDMSFNLQYLSLQQKLQDENRRFTLMSNIMKAKHDTAKNAIRSGR